MHSIAWICGISPERLKWWKYLPKGNLIIKQLQIYFNPLPLVGFTRIPLHPTFCFFDGGLISGDIDIYFIFLRCCSFCKNAHYFCLMHWWFLIIHLCLCFSLRLYLSKRPNVFIHLKIANTFIILIVLRHMPQKTQNPLIISSSFTFESALILSEHMLFVLFF